MFTHTIVVESLDYNYVQKSLFEQGGVAVCKQREK